MGSWSESCGFSGIEIGKGETAYVMLLTHRSREDHGPYTNYHPVTTLIRGEYADYGYLAIDDDQAILDIFNAQSGLTLVQGHEDPFSIDHLSDRPDLHRFWIHGRVFDLLGQLTPEFPSVYDRDKGESFRVANIQEAMEFADRNKRAKFAKAGIRAKGDLDLLDSGGRSVNPDLILMLTGFDFDHSAMPSEKAYRRLFGELLVSGGDPDALFRARARNGLLEYAASELRKKIVPSEMVGPQHAGDIASVQMAEFIIGIQEERRAERGHEDEDLDPEREDDL